MNSINWPLSPEQLEQYRLQTRRMRRSHAIGGHLTRRMGQSLEFREYADYHLGDDIRHVDWQASWRRSGGRVQSGVGAGWLVRKFRAEEHYKLVISLDTRETMTFPVQPSQSRNAPIANISKLQMARWLATAVAFVALRDGNEVVFHNLFGKPAPTRPIRQSGNIEGVIEGTLDTLTANIEKSEKPNLEGLHRHLPPTAIWLIITDFYFDLEKAQALAERINSAQDGMRWVILVEMDSWPYEKQVLSENQLCLIKGPGLSSSEDGRKFNTAKLAEVKNCITQHRDAFLASCQRGARVVHWSWEGVDTHGVEQQFQDRFKNKFLNDSIIRSLFQREI